ncbi:MAG TPA: FAD-dependent oxidoreductase [Steroidobacteraceae bacterium]|nr:FAD-dependent oxidoreductase [Steroidobacteraceae bacterium]
MVIGGGIVGCSVLYHLTALGWKDVVLCERKELTAGSSWHAAGQIHAINADPSVARLQSYTIGLYRELEELSGQDVGLHITGGLILAETEERWDFLRADCARQQLFGAATELVSPAQIRELCPLVDTSRIRGAIYDPREGHVDPSGATHAFAKAARLKGAEIYRRTRVLEVVPNGGGAWRVVTDQGTIECEHVVNAAGLWAREVGHMVGAHLPLLPMEHHYLVTEELEELKARSREVPGIIDLDGEIYLRQEGQGMLLGVYEKQATPWALDGTPWDYPETELLPNNLDRLADTLAKGFERFPALGRAGIRRIVNGPFTFTPDGNPLVGPVPGVPNYWAACGVMAGFCQGGGVGRVLSQWIVEGEPQGDVFAADVARFGAYVTRRYVLDKAREFYSRRFQIPYPNEHWPAGRPSKTSAAHEMLKAANAVFGVSYGLEYPLYFSPAGQEPVEVPTLRRSNAFHAVGEECRAARSSVALLDISSFSKYEVAGPRAERALDTLLAGRLPAVGRVRLTPMLAPSGCLMGDLTTLRLAEDRFRIGGSGYLQTWHMRWFAEHLAGEGVEIKNLTDAYGALALIGPRSRELLGRLTQSDVSNSALPFMSVTMMDLAFAPAIVVRISVTGELAYEVYVPSVHLAALYAEVGEAAVGLGMRPIGMYALNSLRLEKGFGVWSREFSRDYTPRMCGLDRFIAYEKPHFVGRDAALRDRVSNPKKRLVTLALDTPDADAAGYEPIWHRGQISGFITSGGYGHCAGTSLAMGYLDSGVAEGETELWVSILGEQRRCRILREPAIDPGGARMRA